MKDVLFIKGAREHNLKNIDVEIPRNKLVVITGLSGSGKSSLAFDTIYAEGQRRYVESLSSYARQFLGQMEKPDVDYIEGLSPAISIDQKTTSKNPRSTVGTVTEIHDYLRLLYARAGVPHCVRCGRPIERQTVDQITDAIRAMGEGKRLLIAAPVVRGRKGEYRKLFEEFARQGYARVNVDGVTYRLDEEIVPDKNKKHNIDVVVDRIEIKTGTEKRLAESLETALALAGGLVKTVDADSGEERVFSQAFACPDCGLSIEEISPRMFSFNNPYGACPHCHGLGSIMKVDPDMIVPDPTLSLAQGAIRVSGWNSASGDSWGTQYFRGMAERFGFSMDTPFGELPQNVRDMIFYGTKGERFRVEYRSEYGSGTFFNTFEGIITNLERRYRETNSDTMKEEFESYMNAIPCPVCKGTRFKPETLAVKVGGLNIAELSDKPVTAIIDFFDRIRLTQKQMLIAERIVKELRARLRFLVDVGLNYLTLSRASGTLSGGEAQRIRLATQIGSGLVGVLYILDEPSIGLHQRDNRRLLNTLEGLRDLGNTLIVVEHDEETIRTADYVLDIGPGAGAHGGHIVAAGTPEDIMRCEQSVTGQFLSGRRRIGTPEARRRPRAWLTVRGASENNLKHIDVDFPLGVITAVTGVSGSGKSTLVNEILYKAVAKKLYSAKDKPGAYAELSGLHHLDKVVDIDQSPIGRTPRSNPATYTGLFTDIRSLFSKTEEARIRGYAAGRFSFNVKGGRCEACRGDGVIKIEMHFLPDVYVTCEVCKGRRYNRETLEVHYKGKNIHDVLDMTVEEAYAFFSNIPPLEHRLKTLVDVGLSYIKLGQPSTTLSGGEAQRVKLATYLSKRQTGNTLFILDEPTTGLHMADTERLIHILQRLADKGNSVIVIEHNVDVIRAADYVIDLGPEGGDAGGEVIAAGTPEELARMPHSYTGAYLKRSLSII